MHIARSSLALLLLLAGCIGASDGNPKDADADADADADTDTDTDADTDTDTPVDADRDGHADDVDCDDFDDDIHPGAEERCNGEDDDCDGEVDGASATDAAEWYVDADEDGFGDSSAPTTRACEAPAGHSAELGDCDDASAAVHPGAEEVCEDGLDNDCDGTATGCELEESYTTSDADAWWFGDSTNDIVGSDVAFGGDLDGDGADDILLASRSLGAVLAVLSSAGRAEGDLAGAMPRWTSTASSSTSWSLAGLGDVDGDGLDDVLVGDGSYRGSGFRGSAWLVSGAGAAWSGEVDLASVGVRFTGGAEDEEVGAGVAPAGDIDGDGLAELLVGGPDREATRGVVYLVYGRGSLAGGVLDDEADMIMEGEQLDSSAGDHGSFRGDLDLDGDGLDDLLFGEWAASDDGQVAIQYGDRARLPATLDAGACDARIRAQSSWDYLGRAVAGGDLDGDGYDEAVLGADGVSGEHGAAYVIPGSSTRLSSTRLYVSDVATLTVEGSLEDDALGGGLSVGDVTGDGLADLAVGVPGEDSYSGAMFVFAGESSLLGSWSIASDDAVTRVYCDEVECELGWRIAIDGDADGDGRNDILLASRQVQRGSDPGYGGQWLYYSPGL